MSRDFRSAYENLPFPGPLAYDSRRPYIYPTVKKRKNSMVTPRDYAGLIEVPYTTVMTWLQRQLIPGAEKHELPSGGWYYLVPADAPKPTLKRGPKPKAAKESRGSRRVRKAH